MAFGKGLSLVRQSLSVEHALTAGFSVAAYRLGGWLVGQEAGVEGLVLRMGMASEKQSILTELSLIDQRVSSAEEQH
ncbi:hypothetical protein Cadr_000024192 [Camelus dromedarius]|uniref:Uncharacterized protein n=1 Tax=Camelus dromedarius TaxID=9838 RepID=A0A5N4CW79_CAMDR|nr:hypothetical protein Cadr_000024192 [Camelus dromedarius]